MVNIVSKFLEFYIVSTQEWQCIKNNVPNFILWPEFLYGCLFGSISGVILLEAILKIIIQ